MFLIEETPAKVLSLIGTAMFSMFLLFGVSFTNASFTKTEQALPDLFAPANVMTFLDNVSSNYSHLIQTALIDRAQLDYALAKDNLAFIIDEAAPSILAYTGLSELAEVEEAPLSAPEVAGAFVEQYQEWSESAGFSVDTLYALLIPQ